MRPSHVCLGIAKSNRRYVYLHEKIKLALIGANARGLPSYVPYVLAHSDEAEFVAVASAQASLDNHLMAFAAEASRLRQGLVVEMSEFKATILASSACN